MERKYFLFYSEWLKTIKDIPQESQAQATIALLEYGINGMERRYNNPYIRVLLAEAKPRIDRNNKWYESGLKGGAPKGTFNNPNGRGGKQKGGKKPVVHQAVSSPSSKFIPPTLEEVKAFIDEHGLSVDAETFYFHYESNGWMVGRVCMKSWRSALRKWNNNQKGKDKENSDPNKPYRPVMPV